jgi:hypothetical protein
MSGVYGPTKRVLYMNAMGRAVERQSVSTARCRDRTQRRSDSPTVRTWIHHLLGANGTQSGIILCNSASRIQIIPSSRHQVTSHSPQFGRNRVHAVPVIRAEDTQPGFPPAGDPRGTAHLVDQRPDLRHGSLVRSHAEQTERNVVHHSAVHCRGSCGVAARER